MNAQPVKVGRKIVGWACGVCGHIDCASRIEHGREKSRSEECCVCATCKAPITTGGPSTQCGACREKERAEREAATATERSLDVWSWEDALKEHDAAWRFKLQSGATGRVLLAPMHGGVYFGGYARLDPTDDDPEPRIESETLQRSEMRAALGAVLNLTSHTDDLIESFVLEASDTSSADSLEAMPHRWVPDFDAGTARCEGCGLYIVAALSLANRLEATVLVGGQYINGGLHLTRPEHRKPFDPRQDGRCERSTP